MSVFCRSKGIRQAPHRVMVSCFARTGAECERVWTIGWFRVWAYMSSAGEIAELRLEGKDTAARLNSLREKLELRRAAGLVPEHRGEVNNHINTIIQGLLSSDRSEPRKQDGATGLLR